MSRPTAVPAAVNVADAVDPAVVLAPTRSRRAAAGTATQVSVLERDAEFAYIRADMRRLLIIAGALLALMIVILLVVDR